MLRGFPVKRIVEGPFVEAQPLRGVLRESDQPGESFAPVRRGCFHARAILFSMNLHRPDEAGIPLGATPVTGGVAFGVWAPAAQRVEAHILLPGGGTLSRALHRGTGGRFTAVVPGIGPGARYRYQLDGKPPLPDPRSRFQPEGVHGPSEVIDLGAFRWSDAGWSGLSRDGLSIYEVHVGTATAAGTFAALIGELPRLRDLGVGAIELLPVADFPGRWNWGYDGVALFAPSRAYGRPEDLQRLVDAAHGHGLGVILDVVYNHLGPDGNVLRAFSPGYYTRRRRTPWGDAIDYDGPRSREVRDFAIDNACMWVRDYRIDGLRLDATHAIADDSTRHLVAELAARARAAAGRPIVLIAEDGRRDPRVTRPEAEGGWGLDAQWADDFHHAVRVRLTGERHAYFSRYTGQPAEIAATIAGGFRPSRERPAPVNPGDQAAAFVFCIQNHDQVGNRPAGERLHQAAGRDLAAVAAALLLLSPETPLIWMGEEFLAGSPFCYFTDHAPELGRLISEGRRHEFAAFPAFTDGTAIPDPQDPATFLASKLPPPGPGRNPGMEALYRELLRLRRDDPVLRVQDRARLQAAGIGEGIVILRRWSDAGERLLLANTGNAAAADAASLAAAGAGPAGWQPVLSTGERRFGGDDGAPQGPAADRIALPARTAILLARGSGIYGG
jgi:maltooligosyltrehalose trehalohydrolase